MMAMSSPNVNHLPVEAPWFIMACNRFTVLMLLPVLVSASDECASQSFANGLAKHCFALFGPSPPSTIQFSPSYLSMQLSREVCARKQQQEQQKLIRVLEPGHCSRWTLALSVWSDKPWSKWISPWHFRKLGQCSHVVAENPSICLHDDYDHELLAWMSCACGMHTTNHTHVWTTPTLYMCESMSSMQAQLRDYMDINRLF